VLGAQPERRTETKATLQRGTENKEKKATWRGLDRSQTFFLLVTKKAWACPSGPVSIMSAPDAAKSSRDTEGGDGAGPVSTMSAPNGAGGGGTGEKRAHGGESADSVGRTKA